MGKNGKKPPWRPKIEVGGDRRVKESPAMLFKIIVLVCLACAMLAPRGPALVSRPLQSTA